MVGTYKNGLYFVNGNNTRRLFKKSLLSQEITCFLKTTKRVYIGQVGGINYFNFRSNNTNLYSINEYKKKYPVKKILKHNEYIYFTVIGHGFFRYNFHKKQLINFSAINKDLSQYIASAYMHNHHVVLGTINAGFSIFNLHNKRFKNFKAINSLRFLNVRGAYTFNNAYYIIVNHIGIFKLSQNEINLFNIKNYDEFKSKLRNDLILSILGIKNYLFLATVNNGLLVININKKIWKQTFRFGKGISSLSFSKNKLLLGTINNGFLCVPMSTLIKQLLI